MMNRILKKLQKYYYMYIKRDPVTYARKLGVRIGELSNSCRSANFFWK